MVSDVKFENQSKTSVSAIVDGVAYSSIRFDVHGDINQKISAWVAAGNTPAPPDVLPEPAPRLVRKSLIIDRLHDAGKLDAAYAVLQSAPLYDRQRWETRDSVYFNDPTLLAALSAVGADPDVILAPE